MSHGPRRLTKPKLDQEIFDLLKEGITNCNEIANRMDYSRATIGQRLVQLEKAHHVNRRRYSQGEPDAWFFGPQLDADGNPMHQPAQLYDLPLPSGPYAQFPLIGGRNMLDFYLFGPAKRNAPRCTACRALQGEPHLRGCLVALVAA